MSEDAALALLRLLAHEGECSKSRDAKRLGLGASELQRLLVALGDDTRFDGLDLVESRIETRGTESRTLLRLTARGRALCAEAGLAHERGDAA